MSQETDAGRPVSGFPDLVPAGGIPADFQVRGPTPENDADRARWRSPFDARVAEAMARYHRIAAQAAEVKRQLEATKVTKTSKKRRLTVTVDVRGRLLEAKFVGNGYRDLTPVELSKLVTDTVKEAQGEAQSEAERLVAPLRVPEIRLDEVLPGGPGEPGEPAAGGPPSRDDGQGG